MAAAKKTSVQRTSIQRTSTPKFQRVQFGRYDATIAGMQHHQGHAHWAQLDIGSSVYLQREPDNRHDTNAIAVMVWDNNEGYIKIGYVARAVAITLAKELDRGFEVEAMVTRRNPAAEFYNQVTVSIGLFAYLPE